MRVKELKELIKWIDDDVDISFYDAYNQCFDNIDLLIRDRDVNSFSLCNAADLYFDGDKELFEIIKIL